MSRRSQRRRQWRRRLKKRIRSAGDIDYKEKEIQINPNKGNVVNSILHEEVHKQYPNLTEKATRKKARAKEKKLTTPKARKLVKKYTTKHEVTKKIVTAWNKYKGV